MVRARDGPGTPSLVDVQRRVKKCSPSVLRAIGELLDETEQSSGYHSWSTSNQPATANQFSTPVRGGRNGHHAPATGSPRRRRLKERVVPIAQGSPPPRPATARSYTAGSPRVINGLPTDRDGIDAQIEKAFAFFDKDRSGTIEKSEIKAVIREVALDIPTQDLLHLLEAIPDGHQLDFHEFKALVKSSFGCLRDVVESTLNHMRQTVVRAKALAVESHGRESLHTQMTNLFNMQHHYRAISAAQASVDSWHYSANSKCYHSLIALKGVNSQRKRTGRMLPMERMHLILTGGINPLSTSTYAEHGFGSDGDHDVRSPSPLKLSKNVKFINGAASRPMTAPGVGVGGGRGGVGVRPISAQPMKAGDERQEQPQGIHNHSCGVDHAGGGCSNNTFFAQTTSTATASPVKTLLTAGSDDVRCEDLLDFEEQRAATKTSTSISNSQGGHASTSIKPRQRRSSLLGNQEVHDKKNDFVSQQLQKLGVEKPLGATPRRNSIERRASCEYHSGLPCGVRDSDTPGTELPNASPRRASLVQRRASVEMNPAMDFSSPAPVVRRDLVCST
ncbi:unnamed protein product [Amoebophrya sp. A25]|nr:unnamed protein product [Amoebophrya sp. A25]|eukprot:GSA25T00017655001.1